MFNRAVNKFVEKQLASDPAGGDNLGPPKVSLEGYAQSRGLSFRGTNSVIGYRGF